MNSSRGNRLKINGSFLLLKLLPVIMPRRPRNVTSSTALSVNKLGFWIKRAWCSSALSISLIWSRLWLTSWSRVHGDPLNVESVAQDQFLCFRICNVEVSSEIWFCKPSTSCVKLSVFAWLWRSLISFSGWIRNQHAVLQFYAQQSASHSLNVFALRWSAHHALYAALPILCYFLLVNASMWSFKITLPLVSEIC